MPKHQSCRFKEPTELLLWQREVSPRAAPIAFGERTRPPSGPIALGGQSSLPSGLRTGGVSQARCNRVRVRCTVDTLEPPRLVHRSFDPPPALCSKNEGGC